MPIRSRISPDPLRSILFLFDLLYLDGYDLRGVPLEERKRLLAEVVTPSERIHVSDFFTVDGNAMLEAARANGLEGIVAKARASKYEGRRSRDWVKIKINTTGDFVIGGFTHGERDYFSSLVLGLYDGDKLVHAGQVGTGFNEKSLKEIYSKLEPLITKKSPFSGTGEGPARRDLGATGIGGRNQVSRNHARRPAARAGVRRTAARQRPEGMRRNGGRAPARGPLVPDGFAQRCLARNRRPSPQADQSQQSVLSRRRHHQARCHQLLRRRGPLILPHLRDRPLSLKRYPNGIHEQFFFQKDAEDKVPEWVRLEPIFSEHNQDKIHYIICNDRATLVYLANLACIDQNPWMSRIGSLDNPDFALIDLDPTEGCPYSQIVEAAQLVKNTLDSVGLAGYPKTTGGDGMHIYIPLEPVYTYEQVRSFAELLSVLVINQNPDLFTTPRTVSRRKKAKVYFDYLQISSAKTIAAPYVLRAHPGAPVSDAARLVRSEGRPGTGPIQHPQCARSFRAHRRSVRRRAHEAAEARTGFGAGGRE